MRKISIGEKRDFKGLWIPQEVYLDTNLTRTERDALIEIISLCNAGQCFASNKHFAEFLGIAKGTAANVIYSLRKKGYIRIELKYKPGSMEIEKRIIKYLDPYSQNNEYPIHFKMNTPIHEKMKEKNTSIKNTEEEYTNKDNQESVPLEHSERVAFPAIELNDNQWHWKNDKSYKDYIEKVLPKYIRNLSYNHKKENDVKGRDNFTAVMTKIISRYFYYYRINRGEYHPWYTQEKLDEVINFFYSWGLSEEGKNVVDVKVADDYMQQFFKHENMRCDYHLAVFATENMLNVLKAEMSCGGRSEWEEAGIL